MSSNKETVIRYEGFFVPIVEEYESLMHENGSTPSYLLGMSAKEVKFKNGTLSYSYMKRLKKRRNRLYKKMVSSRPPLKHSYKGYADSPSFGFVYDMLQTKNRDYKLVHAYSTYCMDVMAKIRAGQARLENNRRKLARLNKHKIKDLNTKYSLITSINWNWIEFDNTVISQDNKSKYIQYKVLEGVRHPYSKLTSKVSAYNINKEFRPTKFTYKELKAPPLKTYNQFLIHVCGIKRMNSKQEHIYVPLNDVLKAGSVTTLNYPVGTAVPLYPTPVPSSLTGTEPDKEPSKGKNTNRYSRIDRIDRLGTCLGYTEMHLRKAIHNDTVKLLKVTSEYEVVDFNKYFLAKIQYNI